MITALHTFIDIFDTKIINQNETMQLKKIVIPIIQRDYAQGRIGADTDRIRKRFLDSLYQAVTEKPITLDFVYGDIDESGVMTPLDGQQRLTTLFLLHWYSAKKENVEEDKYAFLKCFTYETRYSARDFCTLLISFMPTFEMNISEEIIDQPWFPLEWLKDQTISSMLVVLDDIDKKFFDIPNLWHRLHDKTITFFFLPIKDMGLTDELYIKMNSRGKPLTLFEHFKAELERNLKAVDADKAKSILRKIDIDWTDMLWNYRGDDNIIDDEFLRYFRFICDVICYRSGCSPQGKSNDEFDLLNEYFSTKCEAVLENIKTLEDFFDCWCNLNESSPCEFLEKYISHIHEVDKIKIENRYQIDIFEDCLCNYADIIGGRNRKFPLNRIIMIYGIVVYLLNKDSISENEFLRRLRVINNLTQNSEDQISDSENRSSGNRMPAILKQVDVIMNTGVFDDKIDRNFNPFQINEEKLKLQWCKDNPEKVETLFELEDHSLLYGQISIVGLDYWQHFARFSSLLSCNWDVVDCALLATGDYLQTDRNGWRHQLGSSFIDAAWKYLFHNSSNSGYKKTKNVLCTLLSKYEVFTDDILLEIVNSYLLDCENRNEFDWRYYYIKYPSFRPGRYGKYSWQNYLKKPYEMLTMWTNFSWSTNARQPFLFEIDKARINRDDYGQSLSYNDKTVVCENDAYVIKNSYTGEELSRINIAQNEQGIDTEDRIAKGQTQLKIALASL